MKKFHLQDTFYYIESEEEFNELENSDLSEWKGVGFYKVYIHYRFDTYQYDYIENKKIILDQVSKISAMVSEIKALL